MRLPRLLTILGFAAVLYVLAARAFSDPASTPQWLFAVFSLGFALTPLALLGARPGRRVSVLAWMSLSLALALASAGASSRGLSRTHDIAWLFATWLMLDLAIPKRTTTPLIRYGALAGLAIAAVTVAQMADVRLLPQPALGVVVVADMLAVGALHQIVLTRRGYAVEGAVAGIAIVGLGVGLAHAWFGRFSSQLAAVAEIAVAALLWLGHLAWLDPRWRTLRRVGVPVVIACASSFAFVYALGPSAPVARWELGVLGVGAGLAWWASYALVRRLSQRAVWSTSGRLADAAAEARRNLAGSATLEAIATNALGPLEAAFGSEQSMLELFAFEPPTRIRLETGGRVAIRTAEPPHAISRAALEGDARSILDLAALRARVVREPSVRALVDAMESRSVGAVVPCIHVDHLEGILLLPAGNRSEPLSRIETDELQRLVDVLGGALSAALSQRRAESHVHELSSLRRNAEERVAVLEGEVEQLRRQCDVLGRGLAEDQTLHVAYSPSMRRVQTNAIALAPTDTPIWLVAAPGSPVLPVARFIHDRGPRWNAPFVVAECAAFPPDELMGLLFGSEQGDVGWFQSAMGGTLLMRDLAALPKAVQLRLAASLDERTDHSPAAAEQVLLPPRLIAASRRHAVDLRAQGVLSTELVRCFSGTELVIPPLRQRREDVPSLSLLAIDRACRVLGRDPLGIDQTAMAALLDHEWPGDVAELELVLELAVGKAQGTTIKASDLPPLAWPAEDEEESLDGTFSEVERRLLQRALRRSGGNKSEAARRLGLKRTTFLDKLRRYGLEKSADATGDRAVG